MNDHATRVCNTEDLITLARNANRQGFNRQAEPTSIEQVADPDGTHVVHIVLFGHNADHASILHHRCEVLMKTKNATSPWALPTRISRKSSATFAIVVSSACIIVAIITAATSNARVSLGERSAIAIMDA